MNIEAARNTANSSQGQLITGESLKSDSDNKCYTADS